MTVDADAVLAAPPIRSPACSMRARPSVTAARSSRSTRSRATCRARCNHPSTPRASAPTAGSCRRDELARGVRCARSTACAPRPDDRHVRVGRHRLPPAARDGARRACPARSSTRAPGASGRAIRRDRSRAARRPEPCRRTALALPPRFCYRARLIFPAPSGTPRRGKHRTQARAQRPLEDRGLARSLRRQRLGQRLLRHQRRRATSSCAPTRRPTTRSTCSRSSRDSRRAT